MPLTTQNEPPQGCWSCLRRRVRCDQSSPMCIRCRDDGIECLGYAKRLKWIGQPSRPRRAKTPRTAGGHDNETRLEIRPETSRPLLSTTDKTIGILIDKIDFWNTWVVPGHMPAHPPFQRQGHFALVQPGTPSVLQNLFLVCALTIQIDMRNEHPLESRELCYYRGMAFSELNRLLPSATTDSTGYVLSCTIMALLADFGLSQSRAWRIHLNAVRKILQCRGGFAACFESLPNRRRLLLGFLFVDILFATLRSTNHLDSEIVRMQAEYKSVLPVVEQELVLHTHAVPQILLQAMIGITSLRFESKHLSADSKSWRTFLNKISNLQNDIMAFDEDLWAKNVAEYGILRPLKCIDGACETYTKSWCVLAKCHKSATLLYLFYHLPERSKGGEDRVEYYMMELRIHIQTLFALASSDSESAVEAQLWKFANWPVLVLLDVSRRAQTAVDDALVCYARLEQIAAATGAKSWVRLANDTSI